MASILAFYKRKATRGEWLLKLRMDLRKREARERLVGDGLLRNIERRLQEFEEGEKSIFKAVEKTRDKEL